MDKKTQKKIDTWLSDDYDAETRQEIHRLEKENPKKLEEAFYRDLEFGTGGLRGIMGTGTNRMNRYTVGAATQGLANYLLKCFKNCPVKVAIAYDSRHHSEEFAQICADILSANQIQVYLFDRLRPTPELSFAVRHLHCHAGIMITASHNPKEYNGYKVYWEDGGQLVPPHDVNVIREVKRIISVKQVHWQPEPKRIQIIGEEVDRAYLKRIRELSLNPEAVKKGRNIKIVYTPLHGTGITVIPKALKMFGFKNVHLVKEQAVADGDFPTVTSPNPEERSALLLALKKAEEIKADLVLATDPDADRVGIAVRNGNGEMQILNGNQTATLLIYYILSQYQRLNRLSENRFIVKTIVTTDLIKRIATDYNVECKEVLTGFKYIAEMIRKQEPDKQFIAGGEESYGYLVGDFVRDKDAVSSCCLIAEMTAYYRVTGRAPHPLPTDVLTRIYRTYGYYREDLHSITEKGKDGAELIKKMMENYRNNPPKTISGQPVLMMKDYQTRKFYDFEHNTNGIIELPASNVLQFFTADQSKITVRPSGTEPKIKFYFSVMETINRKNNISKTEMLLQQRIEKIKDDIIPKKSQHQNS